MDVKPLFVLLVFGTVVNSGTISEIADLEDTKVFDFDMYEAAINPEVCAEHLSNMSSFEFFDASFRIPKGILTGNTLDWGNYYQCLEIRQQIEDDVIEGKHCTIQIPLGQSITQLSTLADIPWQDRFWNQNISLPKRYQYWPSQDQMNRNHAPELNRLTQTSTRAGEDSALSALAPELGVCIPKSCSVEQALEQYFDNALFTVNYSVVLCRLPGDKPFVPADYLNFVILSIIGFIAISSTCYELYSIFVLKKDVKDLNEVFACASVYRNTDRLFTLSKRAGVLDCLDGMRSLSIIWVIIGHTVLLEFVGPMSNILEAYDWYTQPESIWLISANLSVDTFLMLSGLLLVYTSMNKLSQSSLLKNLHLFYLNRYLRMLPILALAVLLQASLFNHVDDGLRWDWPGVHVHQCRVHWWAALLHIQNYFNPQRECLPHTWYLAVDFQLHLLSPLVLFWVLGSRRSAWASLTVAMLSVLTAGTIFIFYLVTEDNIWTHYYVNTLTRAPVFIMGMIGGYLLYVTKGQKIRLSKPFVLVCWLSSLVVMLSMMVTYHVEVRPSHDSILFDRLVDSFRRPLWSLSLLWVIFACVHGYGGPINWFLSLTIWKFVARISYALYIMHYPLQFIRIGAIIQPVYFSIKNVFVTFSYDLLLSVFAAVLVTVVVDAPFATLQRILLGGGLRKPQPKPDSTPPVPVEAKGPEEKSK